MQRGVTAARQISNAHRQTKINAGVAMKSFKGQTIVLNHDHGNFFGNQFDHCKIKFGPDWTGNFLSCVFIGCEFVPPIVDGRMSGTVWAKRHYGSVIL